MVPHMNTDLIKNYHDPELDLAPFAAAGAIQTNDDGSLTLAPDFPARAVHGQQVSIRAPAWGAT